VTEGAAIDLDFTLARTALLDASDALLIAEGGSGLGSRVEAMLAETHRNIPIIRPLVHYAPYAS